LPFGAILRLAVLNRGPSAMSTSNLLRHQISNSKTQKKKSPFVI